MRDRRRHLVGFSAGGAAAARRRARRCRQPRRGSPRRCPASPRRARSRSSPRSRGRPKPAQRPTDDPDPNRNAYTVPEAPRSPACSRHFCVHWVAEGIDAPSLDRLATATASPTSSSRCCEVAEHVHEIENGKLGWREPKSDGREGRGRQDRHLPLPDRRRTVRLRGSRPRPDRPRQHRIPRRLHGYLVLDNDYSAFEFPGTKAARRPRGDPRPRVQPHPPVRLRRLPGPLVRRVDRDLDGGPGLRRHRRLPALRAALGEALGHAADRELDQGVRLGGLEPVAGAALRRRRSCARPGRGRSTSAPAASRSAPTSAAIRAAGRSDLGHDFAHFAAAVAEWRTGEGFERERPLPRHAAAGRAAARRPAADAAAQPHHLRSCCGCTPAAAAPSSCRRWRRAGSPPAWPWSAAIGSERQGRTVTRLDFSRGGGRLSVRLGDPGRFSRITAVVVNADAAPAASARAGSTGAT